MKDDNKTIKQLIDELMELRSQNAALEKSVTGSLSAEHLAEEAGRYAESIVETVREPLLIMDADLKIISANRNFYRTFKVTPGETIGSFIYDLGNRQWDIPKLRELLEEVLPEKEAFDDFEVEHNFQDIGHKIMLLNARQILRKDIGAKMILLAIEDITVRREIENGLEKTRKELEGIKISEDASHEYTESLINTIREPLIALDQDLRVVTVSRSFYDFFKVKPEDTVGQLIYDLGNKQWDIPKLRELLETILPQETTFDNYEVEHEFATIGRRIMLLNARQIQQVLGKERIILLAIEDITERKRAEVELQESENMLRIILNTVPQSIFWKDKAGVYLGCNNVFSKATGFDDLEQIVGKTDFELPWSKAEAEAYRTDDAEVITSGKPKVHIIEPLQQADGRRLWIDTSKMPLLDSKQEIRGILGIYENITERKHVEDELHEVRKDLEKKVQERTQELQKTNEQLMAEVTERKNYERALRESEERYRSIFENVQEGIFRTTPDGKVIMANQALAKMYGYESPEEGITSINDVAREHYVNPEDRRKLKEMIEEHGGIKRHETQHYRKDGSIFWISLSMDAVRDEKGQLIYYDGIAEDITNRKESTERMRKALGATVQAIAVTVETRDPYTAGHQRRVADLARSIATEMNLPDDQIDGISMAATIHDLGKISVPAEILTKPTKLKKTEFDLIKEHSQSGYDILKDIDFPWPVARIVLEHHERIDGSGYPNGLAGDNILMESRIIAVADVVESMGSHRPYRPSLGIEAALEEIEKNKGTFYDNTVANVCMRLFREKGYRLEGT